jgi:hypothetical protein
LWANAAQDASSKRRYGASNRRGLPLCHIGDVSSGAGVALMVRAGGIDRRDGHYSGREFAAKTGVCAAGHGAMQPDMTNHNLDKF